MENNIKRLFIHFQSDLLPVLFDDSLSIKPPAVCVLGIGHVPIHHLDIMAMDAVGLVVHEDLRQPKSRLSADDIMVLAEIIREESNLEIFIIKPVSPVSALDLLINEDPFVFDRCLISPMEKFDEHVILNLKDTKIKHQKSQKPLKKAFNNKSLQKKGSFYRKK